MTAPADLPPLSEEERRALADWVTSWQDVHRRSGQSTAYAFIETTVAQVGRLLAERDSLAERVREMDATERALAAECVRRQGRSRAGIQRHEARAAIDALVPPVAPPEDTKEARS